MKYKGKPQLDSTLIRRCLAGDANAFSQIFEGYKNLVFHTAFLMLDSADDAEDVLQDVFIQVYRSLHSYDLEAVEELHPLVPPNASMAQMALRWILMFEAVTCTIPGAKRPSQAEDNIRAAELPPLSEATMEQIRAIYNRHIRAEVHGLW